MRQKKSTRDSAERAVRDIRRATRRQYTAEEKIRIVLEGLRGEDSIAELCRKEGINQNLAIAGPKSSSKRARSAWRVTPPEQRPRTRSRR